MRLLEEKLFSILDLLLPLRFCLFRFLRVGENLKILIRLFPQGLASAMNEIPIAAQQLIVDNIKARTSSLPRVVLCHDAGLLTSEETCQVCTHDKFEDHILRNSIELVSVFPSVGVIRRALKTYRDELLNFEAIFACHHSIDPLGISIEVLNKFGTDCRFIQEIHFLVDLPKIVSENMTLLLTGSYLMLFCWGSQTLLETAFRSVW